MVSASAPCQQGPHFSPHSKAKANYKSTNLRKTQELTVFGGRQKLTSAMKLRPEK